MPESTSLSTSTSSPQGNYEWVDVYTRFADRLLEFRHDRPALIECIRKAFDSAGMKMPTLEKQGYELSDICPFTVIGLFNKNLTLQNRKKLLNALLRAMELDLKSPTTFDGIPTLNPQMATFYWFIEERGENDIETLWRMFETALAYADSPSDANKEKFISCYNSCQQQKGVKWNLSMGLYWIRPYFYLSLDGRNRWYLEKNDEFSHLTLRIKENSSLVPNAAEYLNLAEQVRKTIAERDQYSSFVDFSYKVWLESERINKEKKAQLHTIVLKEENGKYHADIDISVEEWKEMLLNKKIFYPSALSMILSWYRKPNHQAGVKSIIEESPLQPQGFPYNTVTILGKQIINKLGRFKVIRESNHKDTYWCIPFEGWEENNNFIWKVRDELAEAIRELGLAEYDEPTEMPAPMAEEQMLTAYTADDFLNEVYISARKYQDVKEKLLHKKNIILQGAPGVGKTFSAERLAWSIMGCKDRERVMLIQFHQSYSYEDFIMGYRPQGTGFELKFGPFYKFCKKAANDAERPYFFIIDEINRGNLSKIFGELFMLMEKDYRGRSMPLLYTEEEFAIPKNLYIIGMMNTADRSLAMLDYALRRRFAFFELEPGFRSEGFMRLQQQADNRKFDRLIGVVEQLNDEICRDDSLGKGFRIGHSYFCCEGNITDAMLESIVQHELIPLLEEYWFDEQAKVDNWTANLLNSLQ